MKQDKKYFNTITLKQYLKMDCTEDFDYKYCESFCHGEGCKEMLTCKAYQKYKNGEM